MRKSKWLLALGLVLGMCVASVTCWTSRSNARGVVPASQPHEDSWTGEVLEVHDGDTVRVRVDLKWDVERVAWVRMLGVFAPELSRPGGNDSRAYLMKLCPVGSRVLITSQYNSAGRQVKSFDRYVAALHDDRGNDICEEMKTWLTKQTF